MPYANKSVVVLATAAIQVTRIPTGSNSPELFPKTAIAGVYPIKINDRPSGPTSGTQGTFGTTGSPDYQNWTYRFDKMVQVVVEMTDGSSLVLELAEIVNTSGTPPYSATVTGQQQFISDINTWLGA